ARPSGLAKRLAPGGSLGGARETERLSGCGYAPTSAIFRPRHLCLVGVNYSCAAATIRTVHSSSLLPSSSRGPVGCGKRAAFSKGCGRVPVGGWGRQPSIPRQTAGRGDGGAGEEGALSTEDLRKTATPAAQ